jgi:hypothetical protein
VKLTNEPYERYEPLRLLFSVFSLPIFPVEPRIVHNRSYRSFYCNSEGLIVHSKVHYYSQRFTTPFELREKLRKRGPKN